MEFFIRLEKELQKITMHSDSDDKYKYNDLKKKCFKLGIKFKSFTIDLNKITYVEIFNMFEFIKLKNNNICNINVFKINEDINLEDEINYEVYSQINSQINSINEEFAAEYFKFTLDNLQIDLGWRAKSIEKFYIIRPSSKKN